jgi:ADP-ribose pyrophosphatase YjhB (NUDIX family)
MKNPNQLKFLNANLEEVPYDGSEITWRVSAYALIIQNNQLLLAKNRLEQFYDVLGGGVAIGETIEETLVREALEEGGANIAIGKLQFSAMDWFYHRKGKFYQTLLFYYDAELIGEPSDPSDPNIEWTGFVPLEEVGLKFKLAAPPEAVECIKNYLREKSSAHQSL